MFSLRELIREAVGVSMEVDTLSEDLSKIIFDNLKYYQDAGMIEVNEPIKLSVPVKRIIVGEMYVNFVRVIIAIMGTSQNSIAGGSFSKFDSKRYLNGNEYVFDLAIKLKLNWDLKTDIKDIIFNLFSHELHHAYDYMLRVGKKSKTKSFMGGKNATNITMGGEIKGNPALKDFMDYFYLAMPEEVNARVQEAYAQIKNMNGKSSKEIMDKLYQTKQMAEAQKMLHYSSKNVLTLPVELLNKFMQSFNSNMGSTLTSSGFESEVIKYPKQDPTAFFEFWRKRINREGDKLFKKIVNLIAIETKETLGEIAIWHGSRKIISEIYGYDILSEYENFEVDY